MKKFKVVIPEKRVEVVKVLYTIEAKSEKQIRELMDDFEFRSEEHTSELQSH